MLFWNEFSTGTRFFSRRAHEALNWEDVQEAFRRYERGDWGDLPQLMATSNPRMAVDGGQVVGFSYDRNGQSSWIITEPLHRDTFVKRAEER
jgi:hypothetical protein